MLLTLFKVLEVFPGAINMHMLALCSQMQKHSFNFSFSFFSFFAVVSHIVSSISSGFFT